MRVHSAVTWYASMAANALANFGSDSIAAVSADFGYRRTTASVVAIASQREERGLELRHPIRCGAEGGQEIFLCASRLRAERSEEQPH